MCHSCVHIISSIKLILLNELLLSKGSPELQLSTEFSLDMLPGGARKAQSPNVIYSIMNGLHNHVF